MLYVEDSICTNFKKYTLNIKILKKGLKFFKKNDKIPFRTVSDTDVMKFSVTL